MKNWHSEKFIINDTNVNFDMIVPIYEMFNFVNIATFNHSKLINLDHDSMQKNSNAFWVVTKMKFVVNSDLKSSDKAKVTTWTHPIGMLRAMRDSIIKVGNSVKAKATAEWCCLDYDTRRLRKLSTIAYPELDMEITKSNNLVFHNVKENVEKKNFVYSRVVRSTDTDVNNHTNNLKYHFMALDCFTVQELRSFKIKEYEINFVNESKEGEIIDIFKKKIGKNYYIEGRVLDKTIFKVFIKTKKREN